MKNWKSSIKTKLIVIILSVIFTITTITLIVSSFLNYRTTIDTLKNTMKEVVQVASGRIQEEIDGEKRLIYMLAQNPIISDLSLPVEERFAELKNEAEVQGFTQYGMTDKNGLTSENKTDISKSDYFQYCKTTKRTYVSEPIIVSENSALIMLAGPILVNGNFEGIVFFCKDASSLSDIVADIKVGEQGTTSILNKKGETIAYPDYQFVLNKYNSQEEAKTNKKLKALSAIEADMVAGNENVKEYVYEGKKKDIKYTLVDINTLEDRLIRAAVKSGISKDNIKITDIGDYWRWRNGPFLVSRQYDLKITDPVQLNKFISSLDKQGVTSISFGELKNKDMEQYDRKGRIQALENARDKATYMVQTYNGTLGSPKSIDDGNMPIVTSPMIQPRMFKSAAITEMADEAGNFDAGSGTLESLDTFPVIRKTYTVNVVFDVNY